MIESRLSQRPDRLNVRFSPLFGIWINAIKSLLSYL